jgi:hypothetical protein
MNRFYVNCLDPLFLYFIEDYFIIPIMVFFFVISIGFFERTLKHIRIKKNKYKDILYILISFILSYIIHDIVSLNLNNIFLSITAFVLSFSILIFIFNLTKGTRYIGGLFICLLLADLSYKNYNYFKDGYIENNIYISKLLPKINKKNKKEYLKEVKNFINEN